MKPFTTADRLKQLMKERGLRQIDIIHAVEPFCDKYKVNFGKSVLSQYVSGRSEPKEDKLSVISLGLNVSEAWLMGYDVPMERPDPANDEAALRLATGTQLFKKLPADKQDMIISLMKGLLGK